jgi:transcriptional regulator with GAF, ATPase, and Fis domain
VGNHGSEAASHSEEAFQKLLLDLSQAALQNEDSNQLILSFCQLTRVFFSSSGSYFWRYTPDGELVGAEADGHESSRFLGLRVRAGEPSVAMEAVQKRQLVVVNEVDPRRYPKLADFHAAAVIAAPLMVAGEVAGAVVLVRTETGSKFDDDAVAKVAILATQLGTALEALRLNRVSREEQRRASILVEVATALHGLPDTSSVMEGIADRLRTLLRSPIVLIFVQRDNLFQLQAVATEGPGLAGSIRARARENNLRGPSPRGNASR